MAEATSSFKLHRQARELQQEQLRRNIVNATCIILSEEGTDAITIRNVAGKLECSTKIVYNLFGSKEKLVNGVFVEGCSILREIISGVQPGEDPAEYLTSIGEAYWNFAHQYAHFYNLMFNGELKDFKPDEQSIQETATALSQITDVLQTFQDNGKLKIADPLLTTQMFWSSLHGVIQLSSSGHFKEEHEIKELYQFTLNQLVQLIASK